MELGKEVKTTETVMVYPKDSESDETMVEETDETMETTESQAEEEVKKEYTQAELEEIFDLKNKVEGTKIFYSENLGIGFTYLPISSYPYNNTYSNYSVKESGNIITLGYDNTVETFQKDPNLTLLQTIEKEYLSEADPKKCLAKQNTDFVKTVYIEATQFGRTDKEIEENPFLSSEINCPDKAKPYVNSESGFFFDLPDKSKTKYVFINLGKKDTLLAGYKNKTDAGFEVSFYQSIEFVENFDKILSEK